MRPATSKRRPGPVSSAIGSASMSPRSSTVRPALPRVEHRDRAGARRPFAPFERQVGELRPHLGQGLGRFEPELGLGMDRAAQRGDALGDPVGVLEQILCQHHGIIVAGERARQLRTSSKSASVPLSMQCRQFSLLSPFRCPDGNRASAYGRIAYADDILGSLLVFDGFVAGRDLCGRQHDRGHSPASRQDQCRKDTDSIALRATAE